MDEERAFALVREAIVDVLRVGTDQVTTATNVYTEFWTEGLKRNVFELELTELVMEIEERVGTERGGRNVFLDEGTVNQLFSDEGLNLTVANLVRLVLEQEPVIQDPADHYADQTVSASPDVQPYV